MESVTEKAIAHFRPLAEKILATRDPADALAAALAYISGTTDIIPRSLLTKKEVIIESMMYASFLNTYLFN